MPSFVRQWFLWLVKVTRRVLASTSLGAWPAVAWLYRTMVRVVFGRRETTATFRGVRLTVPPGDYVLVVGLLGGFYERIELDLVERLAIDCRMVLDVGANIGIYSCVAAARMGTDSRVVAFEPVPANVEQLRRNVAQNGLNDRVRVIQVALGEATGQATLHLATNSFNHSLAAGYVAANGESLLVSVTSLDDYLSTVDDATPVDLIKIDTEGYDGYVLRGAVELLRKHRPTLFVELAPRALANAGFSVEAFVDLIFEAHGHVYVIDEPAGRCDRRTREELVAQLPRAALLNVVASSRPEHIEVIEQYRSQRALPVATQGRSHSRPALRTCPPLDRDELSHPGDNRGSSPPPA